MCRPYLTVKLGRAWGIENHSQQLHHYGKNHPKRTGFPCRSNI